MIRFRSSVHTLVFALLTLLTSAWPAHAQFSVTSPTTSWNVVPYPAGIVTDYFVDQQTGSGEADIVGGGLLPSFYTQYIPGGTPNTGTIYFRMRLGADDSPGGFKGACFLGVDANADGKLDVFFGVDNSGSSNGIYIWAAGNNLNISPSTTSIDSNNPLYSSATTASNYSWVPVTVTNDPAANTAALLNTDGRTGAGQNDHFLSFSIPFSSVVTALSTAGVTGVTENTSMRYVMGTATQANSFNQDLNGVNGGVNSSLTWADLGAITTPLNVTGTTTNVAPLNVVPGTQSVAMNGTVAISGISVSDADGNLSTVRLTATQGTVQVSLVGGATITAGASGSTTLTVSGTQAQINAALGTVTFNPNTNYSGGASITVLSTDSSAATDSDVIAITVQANQPPEADNDTATTLEDTAINFPVLSNDSDSDGGVLSVTSASVDAASGLVSVNPNNTLTFTPALNFNGTATISYSISDGQGGTASATAVIAVTPVNDDPIADADAASTSEDMATNIAVLTNDSDVDGDILSITEASVSPTQGTVAINGGTTLTFTPAANFHGPATITYTITDGKGGTASTTVVVTVTAANDAPVAVNDIDSTNEDVATTVSALANDTDADGDQLTITSASVSSAEGSAVVNGGSTITFNPVANFHGSAVINYSITDGNGGTASATITVAVTPANDAPVATNDTTTTEEDTATTITVLTNDSDLDGDVLSVTSASVPAADGTVVVNANGTLAYSPAPDFHGSTTITYSISDGNGGTASATVTVTVTPVNDAPVAINDTTSTARATNKTFAVLGNDFDVDGDTLRVTGASVSAAQGSVVVNADFTLTFTPLNTFTGAAAITYFITDDQGGSASAIASVNVLDGNQPPVAVADSSSTNEDVALNINVLGNDSDPDGDALSVISATIAPTQGTVAVNADKTLLYTPAPNFHGTPTITYTISDGLDGTNSAQMTVTVVPLNDEPVAVNDVTSTPEDTAKTIAVLANDSDVDEDILLVVTASVPPLEGTVTVNPDGTITFTPVLNTTGNATIQYTISDGKGGSAAASALVTVTPVNDTPVAVNDAAMTPEDTATTAAVLSNDSDVDGDALTITTANVSAAEGTLVINAGQTLTFTPATNFHGTAVVSYSISDGQGGSDSATLTVTVNPTNDAPVAVNDSATTEEEVATTVTVLSNDSDVDEDELSVSAASVAPAQGSVSINAGATLTFTPADQFHGTATINYSIADGHGGTSSAIVTVTITPKNDAPVAVNDIDSTEEDTAKTLNILVNDSDVDEDTLVITTATIEPAQGSVVINPDQTLTFTPAANFQGSAVISYSITDGNGGTSSATVTVAVTPANDAPVAVNDTAQTPEDVPVTIDVLANDNDPDGDTLVVSNASVPPNQGTISVTADGKLVFVPVANFSGTAVALYELSDGNGGTATATVTIIVDSVNDTPVAANDSGTTPQGRPIIIDVLTNDTDTEGQPLSVTGAELKNGSGAVTVQSDGSVEFTPAAGFIGTATISYVADDGAGGTATAFITVTVDGLPIALNDQAGTAVNAPVTITVLANDGDPEGLPLTVTSVTISEMQGSVAINPDGTVTFTPASGLAGAVSFPYVVMDAAGNTASATVNVTVGNGNATSPVAVTDYATTVLQTPVNISVLANDLNPGGGTLSVTTATADSASGSVLVNVDGTLTFTAANGFSGSATIVYTVASTSGGTATGQVFVEVSPGNAAPVAAPDFATATTGVAKMLFVLANDSDPDGDVLSIVSASADPLEGTVTVNPDGTLTYLSTPAFAGQAHLIYTIKDDSGSEASSTVTVTVAATQQNQAPVAVNDAARGSVDLPMDARVLLNDSDADGDPLIVTAVTVIEGAGTATINPDGSVHFVPATGFNDIARISYTVSDGNGGTDTGILTINVNDDPVAVTDNVQTTPQTAVTVAVLANDSDPNGNPLSLVAGSTSPADGSIGLNPNGTLTFTPNNGFTGTAVVFYTITDGKGGSAEGTVNIVVNTAPQLTPDFGSTVLGQPLILVILPNDTDPDGDTLSVIGATVDPIQGTVEINPDGTLTFTPAATFSGPAVITYVVQDSRGGTSSTTATISRANSTPTADAREVYTYCGTSLMINPMRTAADVDGDSLTVLSVSKPSKGSATIQANGYILYKPGTMFRGLVTDSFVVTLSDGQGGTTQELITVRSFQQIAGTFQGLLTEASPSQLSASQVSGPSAPAYRGRITATLNSRAAFTARLELDGKVARFTGTLTGALQATRRVKIGGKTVTVALKYHDLTDSWSANIDGDAISIRGESCVFRLAKSGRNRSSTYQVSMATSGSAALASAEGSAIARVRSSGAATMVGTLPDGSKFSVGSRTNAHAGLSVYRWLGQGVTGAPVLGGVLELQGVTKDSLSGDLSWRRPASEVVEILSVTGAIQ